MVIRGGAVALPGEAELVRVDLKVIGEQIVGIGRGIAPAADEVVVDAEGLAIFPGAIDPHVHFDTPGFEKREDFLHGSMAAARGGVTTVIDMPCTSLPPVTTVENLKVKLRSIEGTSVVDFALFGGVSGLVVEESIARHMAELAPFVVGFKCYFLSGMETFTRVDHLSFARAVEKAAQVGRPLLLHAEDYDYVTAATRAIRDGGRGTGAATGGGRAVDATGAAGGSWADYVASRPEAAELAAAASALALARGHEASLHVVHVGTSAAAELLAAGGATCETCPHYLAFSSADFERLGSALKTAPPVKSPGEAERLWRLLGEGRIAFAASDHAPAPFEEKHTGSVWTDYGGIPGTGTLFPYLYSEGLRTGRLDLARFLEALSGGAAARYGLAARKGSIEVGKDADLAVVDPAASRVVRGAGLLSKGSITPFEGMTLRGEVVKTFVRGRLVWDATRTGAVSPGGGSLGIAVPPGHGKYLQWGYR